jgi:hypothetical protein
MTKTESQVIEFIAECRKHQFVVERAEDGLVTIVQRFDPSDVEGTAKGILEADANGPYIMSLAPATQPGSVWGTTSDGVGFACALKYGVYRLNKSGVSKRFTKALANHPYVKAYVSGSLP